MDVTIGHFLCDGICKEGCLFVDCKTQNEQKNTFLNSICKPQTSIILSYEVNVASFTKPTSYDDANKYLKF